MADAASNRDRLLSSAARLLAEQGVSVSTRAICAEAGVTAPTLYHYFGDREGLLQAVVTHGFAEYLAQKKSAELTGDPIADIRAGWFDHQAWGVANPSFYALMYGQVLPGKHPSANEGERLLTEKLDAAARLGLLQVPPPVAMRMILSANIGLTLTLISQPESVAPDVSERLIAALLESVMVPGATARPETTAADLSTAASAIALRAALADSSTDAITPAERPLLDSWLDKLAERSR